MSCLLKYRWVKLPRALVPSGKGVLGSWARLAARAAFRAGAGRYCGHLNAVTPGMWSGGIVGVKSILGVRRRGDALRILGELQALGYITYTLDPATKKLEYRIRDWVLECFGEGCSGGAVYATDGYGFICLPRNITQRLADRKIKFGDADAWLDLWCHTVWQENSNAFSYMAPTVQFGTMGAALSAAWELRHTLFKVLIFLCLLVLFFIILIVSIPSIMLGSVLGDDSTGAQTLQANYNSLAYVVDAAVERGHELALERVEQIISDGGYDYELSMAALIDNAQSAAGYDVGWILAAYSASLAQQDTSAEDMAAKLEAVAADMFPVTYTEGGEAAAETTAYIPVAVTVVTGSTPTGSINGVTQYRYFTEQRTYYVPDGTTTEPTATYSPVTVTVPVYSGGQITGTRQATYYTPSGSAPEASRVVVCTIHPFDSSVIYEAFGIDPDAVYDQFNITCAEAIDYMADALSKTLYGAENSTTTSAEAMSEAEISALVSALDCSGFSDWTYQTALGVTIGAGTWGQWNASTEIAESELIPGDLGFQNLPNADTNHVLIYAGTDAEGRQLWVHCTSGSGVVLNSPDYIRYYRRPNAALGDT